MGHLASTDPPATLYHSNTAFGGAVEPLPFHAMRSYPYGPDEHYPDDAVHNEYRRTFNTRPALRLIRPLRARK